ncbi:MAG: hypothetical protein QW568_02355 [Candidatus Anstonellaceae archaeon]
MPPSGQLLAKKSDSEDEQQSSLLALLPLVTFEPLGNPLDFLQAQQRRMFFDILARKIHAQQESEKQKDKAIVSSSAAAQGASLAAMKITLVKKEEGREREKQEVAHLPTIAYPHSASIAHAHERLAAEIDDYARGNSQKAQDALSEFESRLRSQGYKTDDLMAVMLLVIEDKIWEGDEGKPTGGQPGNIGMRVQRLVPTKLREAAKDSGEARLASVREMLRYYFQTHPKDYALALAAALSLTSDQEEDTEFLQERLASELARIGGFAFAQKLLAELKRKKKMDTKKCLKELGYRYNAKEKKLILGKRTCGKPAEAKGIVGLLLSSIKKDDGE